MGIDARAATQPGLDLTHADAEFDRVARLVRRHLGVTAAAVTIIGPDGILLPGSHGMPAPIQESRCVESDVTLTRRVVETGGPIVLEDVTDEPAVAAACARYGAAQGAVAVMPVRDDEGSIIGTLAAVNATPRTWDDDDLATLSDLAASCSAEIQIRDERERARVAEVAARAAYRRAQMLLNMSEAFSGAVTAAHVERAIREVVAKGLGASGAYLAIVDADRRGLTFVGSGPDVAPVDNRYPGGPTFRTPRRRLTDDLPICEVVRTGRSMYFPTADDLEAQFPLLRGRLEHRGACSLIPVLWEGEVLAVVCTRWAERRESDPDAAALEVTLAPYVAHALERVSLLDARRAVATTLQAALLTDPPAVDGLHIATTYEPATRTDQVGGDWYDVVPIDENTTVLMIGDVVGHDMQAAAWMGQLRSMLRAFAWSHDETPSVLLTLLDRANDQLGPGAAATAVVVRLEHLGSAADGPMGGTYALTWSNAGHPPPLVLRKDGSVEILSTRTDLLLGCRPSQERLDHTTTLRAGETLVLYTDGLVEQRGTSLAGRIELLAETLGRLGAVGSTASLPAALTRALVPPPQRDDIAVLAVRVRGAGPGATPAPAEDPCDDERVAAWDSPVPLPSEGEHGDDGDGGDGGDPDAAAGPPRVVRAERRLASSLADLGPARRWVDHLLQQAGVGQHERRTAMLLSSELLTNAIEHGEAPITTTVEVDLTTRYVRVGVRDASSEHPQLRDPDPHELSGRGVLFLDRLAARWGVVEHDGSESVGRHGQDITGKTVWFELQQRTPVAKG